jgi:hypothetical protein
MSLVVPSGQAITTLNPVRSSRLTWVPRPVPLFDGPPSIAQTQQGTIADCFILASLIAILVKTGGAAEIQNMMKEDGSDAIVRLFKRPGEPVYFKVAKGVIHADDARASNRTCCWVDVLEACLSVFRMKAQNNSPDVGAPLLENLDNGQAQYALEHLLGATSSNDQVIGPKVDPGAPTDVQARHAGIAFVNLILDPAAVAGERDAVRQMLGGDAALTAYEGWLRRDGARVKGLWSSYIATRKYTHTVIVDNVSHDRVVPISIRQDGFEQFVNQNFPAQFAGGIVAFARDAYLAGMGQSLFPQRRKQGGLSVNEANLFTTISDLLTKGYPVVAASNSWVGRSEGQGFSGGEDMARGIVGGHCYAVAFAFLAGQERMVKLVNPWRKYVRVPGASATAKPTASNPATDKSLGIMDLPIRTVAKHFEYVSHAKRAL